MQNVLILLAMNRNFSNVQRHAVIMQPHMFVVKSTAVTICIQFEVFKAIKDSYCGILYRDTKWSSTNAVRYAESAINNTNFTVLM